MWVTDLIEPIVIIYILILLLPFLILFVPFLIAWLKGMKKLRYAHEKYARALDITIRRLFGASTLYEVSGPLEAAFLAEGRERIQGRVWLVDRRAYFYYLAKVFRPLNDLLFFSISIEKTPGCSMIIVPRDKPSIVDRAMAYSEQLKLVDIRGLDEFFILTDNASILKHVFDRFIIQELINMRRHISYIVVDYTEPNIELYVEVNEGNYSELIPRMLTLIKMLIQNVTKISPRKTTLDTIIKLKRALKQIS